MSGILVQMKFKKNLTQIKKKRHSEKKTKGGVITWECDFNIAEKKITYEVTLPSGQFLI